MAWHGMASHGISAGISAELAHLQVSECRLVCSDDAVLPATLNHHVAQRHAVLHLRADTEAEASTSTLATIDLYYGSSQQELLALPTGHLD